MEQRQIGTNGLRMSALGLGCMGMSPGIYGPVDEEEALATVNTALVAGMTLIDTGDFYGVGHNEQLIGKALKGRREQAIISLKFGALRDPSGGWTGMDCRPSSVKNFLAYSLKRLGTDYVDIYRPARLDPEVPIEETVGAIADLVTAGYVRHIGLSEVGAQTIRRAAAIHPICDLQIEWSLISRSLEDEILGTCRELGIGITAYGVLSRGLISGHWQAQTVSPADFRAHSPRFQAGNLEHNLELVERLRRVAEGKGCTVAQLAVAWVLSRGGDVVPVIGARRPERLHEILGALEVELTPEDLDIIERILPKGAAAGERYAPAQMAHLDSEQNTSAKSHTGDR